MGRRDKDDEQWQELKKRVRKRDRNRDRILKIATAKEALTLKRLAPVSLLKALDCAHLKPVGRYPYLCYDIDNVYLLNRWSHENLDSCKNPFTGAQITYEEREEFWKRIAGEVIYTRLEDKIIQRESFGKEEDVMEQNKESEVTEDKEIFIDNKRVTQEDFERAKEDPTTRLYQEDSNSFRTLKRMNG